MAEQVELDKRAAATAPARGPRILRSTRASRWAIGPGVVALAVLGYLPYLVDPNSTTTLVNFFILLVLGMTWNLLAGYAGLVSVGQQAYIGIGAYATLWFAQHGVEPFVALPIAAVFCAVVAFPLSWLVFRLRGGYFAIGTWVVAEVLALLTIRDSSLGGGTGTNVPGLDGFDPVVLGAITYWAALAVAVLTLAGCYIVLRSRVGLALTAVRDDETAARAVGVLVPRAKRIVYLVAALGAGAAGALLAISQLNVQPNNVYGVQWSAYMIFVVLIGGIGTLEGPIIGTIVFFVLQQTLSDQGAWYLIILGSVAVVMAVWARRGLWGLLDRWGLRLFPVGYRVLGARSGRL
ncbi:MAG TPA: branched-chain amino acid ABC transporter permease [Jatrophihabitantaceae bacterium]|nr:branched-chain amino acid ABC transporter permease [Jatrophihabitantaceae bacterium]